jgi:chromosome segregation ATPase
LEKVRLSEANYRNLYEKEKGLYTELKL